MFDELAPLAQDPDALLAQAAKSLAAAGDLHRLFDLRLLQERRRLGLALDRRTSMEELDEPLRSELEAAYLAACREVGELLLESGRMREAWLYLRPAGEKLALRRRLARVTLDSTCAGDAPAGDTHADELIELALYDGVDPERGFAWLLGRQGTCQGITTLDGLEQQLSVADARACAAVLVRHVWRELQGNLRGHLHRLGVETLPGASVRELIERHPELGAGGNYHLDPSHLASTMRYARLLEEPALLAKALEMAQYGRLLPPELQYAGEAPFEELYPAHERFFDALLEGDVDGALNFFAARATEAAEEARQPGADRDTFSAVEIYLTLLDRLGRPADALEAYRELAPPDRELSRYGPTLLDLATRSGDWASFDAVCRTRNDVLGYAAGLLVRAGGKL